MKKKLSIFLFSFIVISSCQKASNSNPHNKVEKRDTILIGAAGSWDSVKKYDGSLLKEGLEFAADEINSHGGVLGKNIKLVWKNDFSSEKEAKIIADEFCNDKKIVAVIGDPTSAAAVEAAVIYNERGLVFISPTATSNELSELSDKNSQNKFIFRTIVSDDVLAIKMAEYLVNHGYSKRSVVHDILIYNEDDTYGNDLASAFQNAALKYGLKIVTRRTYGNNSNISFFLEDLKNISSIYKFDAIFIAGLPEESSAIIEAIQRLGLSNIVIVLGSGYQNYTEINNNLDKTLADDIISSEPQYIKNFDSNIKTKKFFTEFKSRFGVAPDEDAILGYDTLEVLAKAIEGAKSVNSKDIAAELHKIQYNGASGLISFAQNGNLINDGVNIVNIGTSSKKSLQK